MIILGELMILYFRVIGEFLMVVGDINNFVNVGVVLCGFEVM